MFLAKLAQKVCFLFISMVTETQQARKTYPLGVLASPISHVPYYSGPTAVTSSVLRTYAYVRATVCISLTKYQQELALSALAAQDK